MPKCEPSPNGHPESGRTLLLRAAADLPVRFTIEELTVAAWIEAPSVFGLKGFDEHPDARKIAVLVHGLKGVVAQKLLLKVGKQHFKLAKRPRKPKERRGNIVESFKRLAEIIEGTADEQASEPIEQQLPDKVRERRSVYCRHGQRLDECAACGG